MLVGAAAALAARCYPVCDRWVGLHDAKIMASTQFTVGHLLRTRARQFAEKKVVAATLFVQIYFCVVDMYVEKRKERKAEQMETERERKAN